MIPEEQKYSYTQSQQIMGQTGCIGHLRTWLDLDGSAFPHAEIGNNLYHICEFAERMEAAGIKVEPISPASNASKTTSRRKNREQTR